ncbi:MAG: DUF642 domain-containing protein [Nitrospirae bacterium]|nr:DUF642 domain-containing protein [Nitrospirota bacterium]
MKTSKCLLIIILMLCYVPVYANTNIVINGGFESPDINSGLGYRILGPDIIGWTSNDLIEIQDYTMFTPYDGSQYMELAVYSNVTISQSLATNPNELYTLSFAFAGRPDTSVLTNGLNVFWGGAQLNPFTIIANPETEPGWTVYSYYDLIPTGSATLLQFQGGMASDQFGSYIDGVSVTSNAIAPEPISSILFVTGGTLLAGRRFIRRQA